jgi:hypothetical protein
VMSSIAVFLVLGGATALAASQLGKNTVGTKQLKKNAVTTAKIKKNAVTGAKVKLSTLGTVPSATNATNAVHATSADKATSASHADSATNADNASKLGGSSPSAFQQTSDLLFATVAPANGSAAIARGRGATSVTSLGTGYFSVKFNRDITNCTWVATYGAPNFSGIEGYYASVKGGPQPNEVRVVLWEKAGTQINGLGFHLAVLCP